jgi:hypothetical protein
MNESSLVLIPELAFSALADELSREGWRVESQSAEPIVPGEPEWAIFSPASSESSVHYTFNPVVCLRVLNYRGADGAMWRQAAEKLPRLDNPRLRALLVSEEKRDILLGLFAAGELEETGVLDLLPQLCEHPDARVSQAAVRCRDRLLQAAMPRAREAAADMRKVFSCIPLVEWRRQTVRWMARENTEANTGIEQALSAALEDTDAEVRMTAVLAAAKLKAGRLLDCVRRVIVPESSSDGADERHRLFYRQVWNAAVRYLATGAATDAFLGALNGTLEVKDDPTLLLHSLLTPCELGGKPDTLPAGIEESGSGYRLTDSGARLCWIAPVPHWLGEDGMRDPDNPVRCVRPEAGFFIWEQPIAGLYDYTSAIEHCRTLSNRIEVKLPTPDQWEMAARGPDGRRYPWGNTVMNEWRRYPSPHGVRDVVGHGAEWTRAVNGRHVVCGNSKAEACAKRRYADPPLRAVVRPVIDSGPRRG